MLDSQHPDINYVQMSEQLDDEQDMGVDNLGRKRKPKRAPIKFELQPRQGDEPLEDWIKRETERIVLESTLCKDKREAIIRKDEERAQAGEDVKVEWNELQKLVKQRDRELKKFKDEWAARIAKHKREGYLKARAVRKKKAAEHKAMLAKYNTLYNRYFNAVKVRVFRNMKSLCNIQHTWADKKTKRDIQNGTRDHKKHKPANRRAASGIAAQVKEHAKRAGEL